MKVLITGSNGLLGQKILHNLVNDDSVDLIQLQLVLIEFQ